MEVTDLLIFISSNWTPRRITPELLRIKKTDALELKVQLGSADVQ